MPATSNPSKGRPEDFPNPHLTKDPLWQLTFSLMLPFETRKLWSQFRRLNNHYQLHLVKQSYFSMLGSTFLTLSTRPFNHGCAHRRDKRNPNQILSTTIQSSPFGARLSWLSPPDKCLTAPFIQCPMGQTWLLSWLTSHLHTFSHATTRNLMNFPSLLFSSEEPSKLLGFRTRLTTTVLNLCVDCKLHSIGVLCLSDVSSRR